MTAAKKRPAKKAAAAKPSRRSSKKAAPAKPTSRPPRRLSVNATLAEVRKHPKTAAAVLEAEQAHAAPRPSLVAKLEAMVAPDRPRGPLPDDPRIAQVVEARRGGASFSAIAAEMYAGDEAAARRAFDQGMRVHSVTSVANQILLEHARLDRLQAQVWPRALRGDVDALQQLFRILDERASLPRPLDDDPDRVKGTVEAATEAEADRLRKHAPALAAAVLVLARGVDDNAGDPDRALVIARELRISMTQLRGLAGTRVDDDASDDDESGQTGHRGQPTAGGVVIPEARLAGLRLKVDSVYRPS